MKSINCIVFLFFLLISKLLVSQSLLGVYGGYNSSEFYYTGETSPYFSPKIDSKSTYLFGVTYRSRKPQLLNVALNMDYLKRELDLAYGAGGKMYYNSWDLNVDIHSINFRILPELKLGKKVSVYVNAGPFLGVIINSRKTGIAERNDYYLLESEEWNDSGSATEQFGGVDFGLSASFGLEIPLTKQLFILVDANYSMGLSNISNGELEDGAKIMNSKNTYFTGGIIYKLDNFNISNLF